MAKSWKAIAAVVVAAALGLAVYLLGSDSPKPEESSPPARPESKKSDKLLKDEFLLILRKVNEVAVDLCHELKTVFFSKRRACQTDDEYRQLLVKYMEEERGVISKAIEVVTEIHNVHIERYNAALCTYAGEPETMQLKNEFKALISSARNVPDTFTPETLEFLLQFQLGLLEKLEPPADRVAGLVQLAKVDDQVFEAFGYEADQVLAAVWKHEERVRPLWRKVARIQQRLSQ